MGTNLKNWRAAQNMTQQEAARLLGVSHVCWHKWESGKSRIVAERVRAVSEVTGIPRHELRPDLYEAAQ